jgi:glycosyltransferase involved in cell wall biosynthesis
MSAPSIAVVICTWNRSSLLRTTLLSLNEQSDCSALDIEVIVVDNNSSDDTKGVVEALTSNWKLGELRYAFEARQGKQFALNHGIHLSQKTVIAFTDDDILFPKDWLINISHTFDDKPLDLVGGRTEVVWPEAGKPNWYDPGMSAITGNVDLGEKTLRPPPPGYAPAGANLVARRSLFDRVGLFSESHFRHMDYEFGMRCSLAQASIAYEPTLVVYAPIASECLNKRYFRRWSFKAGIADDTAQDASMPTLLGVPRWVFRQLLEDLIFIIAHLFSANDAPIFSRELRMWRALGTIANRWHAKYRPTNHAKWVESYSQKKKNLY